MPEKCSECHAPATAGAHPLIPERSRCIRCAAVARVSIPMNLEQLANAPDAIADGPAWPITRGAARNRALWLNQANALHELEQGKNIVVATSTASGKSLIFQLWTLHRLLQNPEATALVFHPTRALANDQARRWRECCQTLGLDGNTVGQIDGDVETGQRNRILEESRIMIATPDPALPGMALEAAGRRLRRAERPGRPCRGLRDNPEPNPGVLYPSGVQVSMPEPSKQLASALSVQLTRADKDALDLLAAWPLCTREQLSGLMAVPPWTSCASC